MRQNIVSIAGGVARNPLVRLAQRWWKEFVCGYASWKIPTERGDVDV